MDLLQGVNRVLTLSGHYPVESLDPNGAEGARFAKKFLEEASLRIQLEGWNFNQRTNVEMTPDASGHISLGVGVIAIDGDRVDANARVTQLGEKLYDLTNNTGVFTGPIRVNMRLVYSWECVPHWIQEYIATHAAWDFAVWKNTRPDLRARIRVAMDEARASAKSTDQDMRDGTIFDQVRSTRGFSRYPGSHTH